MASSNDQASTLEVAGIGHRMTNVWFLPNGAANPVSFGGPYVDSITHAALGTYSIVWSGFSPRALIGFEGYAFDNANPTDSDLSPGGAPIITPALKRVSMTVSTIRAVGSTVAKDIAADPLSVVKMCMHWKTYAGVDNTGL